jgi:hypothetical protein
MINRPQEYRPGTSHGSTRYEVEFLSLNGMWCLDITYPTLIDAKARQSINKADGIESRIVVVSESRRLIDG